MIVINLLVFLFIPASLGILVITAISEKKEPGLNFWEKAALSFPLGLGLLAITMYILDMAKIPVTLGSIAATIFIYDLILFVFLFFTKKLKSIIITSPLIRFDLDWQEQILALLISLKVVFVFFSALIKPMIDVDAFQFYSIVAKGLYFKHTLLEPYISHFIYGKPPLPFLAQGWVLIGMQTANDIWLKILSPLLFVSLLIIFYNALRWNLPRKFSLLFTFFLSSLPFLIYHATTAYADIPVTFYFTVSTLYLFRFLKGFHGQPENRSYTPLFISFIAAAITIWAKNAGLMLAGVNLLALAAFLFKYRKELTKKEIKNIVLVSILLLMLIIPLLIPRINFLIGTLAGLTGHNDAKVLAAAKNVVNIPLIEKTKTIGQIFINKLFFYGDWHLTWALLLICLLFFPRQALAFPQRYLLGILILAIMTVFVQFESSGTFVWLLDGTLFDRLIMNEVPLALFLCAQTIIPGLAAVQAISGQKKNAYVPKSSKKR